MNIQEVVKAAGGQSRVARHFGLHRQQVHQWCKDNQVPAKWVPELERMSKVPARDINPGVFGHYVRVASNAD